MSFSNQRISNINQTNLTRLLRKSWSDCTATEDAPRMRLKLVTSDQNQASINNPKPAASIQPPTTSQPKARRRLCRYLTFIIAYDYTRLDIAYASRYHKD